MLSGTLRVLTHPRMFHPATPNEAATAFVDAFVDALLAQSTSIPLRPGRGHWRIFLGLVKTLSQTGNRISDAYHAALAIEHGCEWVTLDRGFSAYPELRMINLLNSGIR